MVGAPPMSWTSALAYTVTPKSGPIEQLKTLEDARSALIDLPADKKKSPHWLQTGLLVVAASESDAAADIHAATDALVHALDTEGWMTRPPAA